MPHQIKKNITRGYSYTPGSIIGRENIPIKIISSGIVYRIRAGRDDSISLHASGQKQEAKKQENENIYLFNFDQPL
jgi:hypothetical protein